LREWKKYSHLEDSLAVSYKSTYALAYNPAISFLEIYPTKMKRCFYKIMCKNIYNSSIHSCPKMGKDTKIQPVPGHAN
jgi:hypothetical protein